MTSSYRARGTTKAFFKAQPVGKTQEGENAWAQTGEVQAGYREPTPPSEPASYAGQVVAVPTEREES